MTEIDDRAKRLWRPCATTRAMTGQAYRFLPSGPPRWASKEERWLFWTFKGGAATGGNFDNRTEKDAIAAELGRLLSLKQELVEIKSQLWRRRLLQSAKAYNPNQPRVPAGNPHGGQWTTDDASNEDRKIVSDVTPDDQWKPGAQYAARNERRNRSPIFVRIGNKLVAASEDQKFRLDIANNQADEAIRKLRSVEPDWRPVRSQYDDTIESKIKQAKDLVLEAEARLVELGYQSPQRLIQTFREQNNSRDLLGDDTWPKDKGVVAFVVVDRLPVFGTNSLAPSDVYTDADRIAADRWRDRVLERYPYLERENVGWAPNDAVYHAEASVLFRAAERNGGTLAGRVMEVHVDDKMCDTSCPKLLPLLGIILGNPRVTFIDHLGRRRTMQNGIWQE